MAQLLRARSLEGSAGLSKVSQTSPRAGSILVKNGWQLRGVHSLIKFSSGENEILGSASTRSRYPAGGVIFTPERSPNSVCLLERGLVRIYRVSESGSETSFGYVPPGEVFGELSAFGDHPRESFADAVLPSTVCKLSREAFQQVVAANPRLAIKVIKQISERLKRIESRVESLIFRDARARVATILVELGEDFGYVSPTGLDIDLPLTQSELAKLVGSTRQTVNASLRELEDEGLISLGRRRILLIQPDGLKRTARMEHP